MGAVATAPTAGELRDPRGEDATERLFEPPGPGGVSLEQRVLATWEDLLGEGAAECLVCGARQRHAHSCDVCGSELL